MTERFIEARAVVPASRETLWECWTTVEGITSFFAPACNVDIQPDGPYEIFFNPDAPLGERGGEGLKVLAVQEPHMLSFTWNAPPSLPEVRPQRTAVVVRFSPTADTETEVILHHTLWGNGGQWDAAYDYFTAAWQRVVMPRLVWRFKNGPIDWNNPPSPSDLNSL